MDFVNFAADFSSIFTKEFSEHLDSIDSLNNLKKEFVFPQFDSHDVVYLCGNSLGLQPKGTSARVNEHLEIWANEAVEGHFIGIS
jgi:kynureninase